MTSLIANLRKARALGPRAWRDFAVAAAELAIARRRLAVHSMDQLVEAGTNQEADDAVEAEGRLLVERVAFAIPRMGAVVPWRSDCLVQALAAKHWLSRLGIDSALHIGVRNESEFAAHAWLTVGQQLVTGGTTEGYTPLLASRDQAAFRRT